MAETKKVLVVEDDTFLSSLLKSRLEKEGITVLQAFDGEEALKMLHEEVPSLMVLDLVMPKVSGFEVLKRLASEPMVKVRQMPIITLTNLGQDTDVEKVKELGATSYFVKARSSLDKIVEEIKETLGGNAAGTSGSPPPPVAASPGVSPDGGQSPPATAGDAASASA